MQKQELQQDSKAAVAPGTAPANPAAQLPSVTNARLMQSFARSEMQVSLHSEEFGRVTVHAAYGRDSIATQITLESSLLSSTLSAHVPSIEQKLGQDHGLRASVTIDTQSGEQSGDNNHSQQQQQSGRRNSASGPQLPLGSSSVAAVMNPSANLPISTSASVAQARRLDIRI